MSSLADLQTSVPKSTRTESSLTTDTEPVSATELTTTESVKVEPVPKTASSITKSPVLPELKISTTAVPIPTVSIVFTQQISDENNKLICSVVVRIACVNLQLSKPCAIPEKILGALKRVS